MTKTEKPHQHTWFLGKYYPSRPITKYTRAGWSFVEIPTGNFHPATSIFVCDCGARKEVTHMEEQTND